MASHYDCWIFSDILHKLASLFRVSAVPGQYDGELIKDIGKSGSGLEFQKISLKVFGHTVENGILRYLNEVIISQTLRFVYYVNFYSITEIKPDHRFSM